MKTAEELLRQANRGIIGIDAEGRVFGGYDNPLDAADMTVPERVEWDDTYERLPAVERARLAVCMIDLWQHYLNAAHAEMAALAVSPESSPR